MAKEPPVETIVARNDQKAQVSAHLHVQLSLKGVALTPQVPV
jgi:hypothetical protein